MEVHQPQRAEHVDGALRNRQASLPVHHEGLRLGRARPGEPSGRQGVPGQRSGDDAARSQEEVEETEVPALRLEVHSSGGFR